MSNLRRMLMIGPAVLLLGIGTSWAHEEVSVHTSPSELWVEPHVVGAGVKLTVSCDNGVHFEVQSSMSERPTFRVMDAYGPTPAARCNYEIRVQPMVDLDAVEAAEAAEDHVLLELLGREEEERMVTVTGSFELVNGQLIVPGTETESVDGEERGHRH